MQQSITTNKTIYDNYFILSKHSYIKSLDGIFSKNPPRMLWYILIKAECSFPFHARNLKCNHFLQRMLIWNQYQHKQKDRNFKFNCLKFKYKTSNYAQPSIHMSGEQNLGKLLQLVTEMVVTNYLKKISMLNSLRFIWVTWLTKP